MFLYVESNGKQKSSLRKVKLREGIIAIIRGDKHELNRNEISIF